MFRFFAFVVFLKQFYFPQNFKMTAQWHIWELPNEDIGGPFNARAFEDESNRAEIQAYLSLDNLGVPLVRSAFPPQVPDEPEQNWEVKDYVDIDMPPSQHAAE